MAVPANWTQVLISGTYLNVDGSPAKGFVEFSVSPGLRIVNTAASVITIPKNIRAELDSNGSFSVLVPATDDPDIDPHFAWKVWENIKPNRRRIFYVKIPYTETSLNLHSLETVTPGRSL